MNLQEQTVAELARNIPGATGVFRKYRLDFCCGGDKVLREAAASRGVDVDELTLHLEQLQQSPEGRDWRNAEKAELIEFILTRYHDTLREQLPELVRLAQRVERVHAGHPDCPAGLAAHLTGMKEELESHMEKEEQILFPMLSRGLQGPARHPIQVMRHEHDEHGHALTKLERLTHDMTPPEGACNTWQALYAGLTQLRLDLMEHIHLENNILFLNEEA